MIYLDSAATSYYRPETVADAVADAIRTMGNCSRGTHEAALAGARVVYETRELLSELFHGEGPDQIAFTVNSTESLNIAIKGVLRPGDRAVTTVLEHNSVLRPLYEMQEQGVSLEIAGCERQDGEDCKAADYEPYRREAGNRGALDYKALEAFITPGTRAVICTHASNLTGNLIDIRRIGGWCRQAGAIFIVDASQTAGVFPIDMEKDMVDILCFTGHKGLMGPQGTGGLCVRKGVEILPLLTGGSGIMTYSRAHPRRMPTALEAGTLNAHGIAGLRAALLYIRKQGMDVLREQEQSLMWRFYKEVEKIKGVRVYGDFRQRGRAAVVALNKGDADSGEISDYLAEEHGIYTRPGGHCAPLMHKALGTVEQGAVRFSFSHFNTVQDVDAAVKALEEY